MSLQPEMAYLRLAQEDSWGGGKGAADWVGASVPADGGYMLAPANTVDRPRKSEGTYQQTRARRTEMAVTGTAIPQVFPSVAQFLVNMFHYRDANGQMYSYVGQWALPGIEYRQHVGIIVNTATISCATGGELMFSFDCIAKNEEGDEDAIPSFPVPSFPTVQAYYFLDAQAAGAYLKYQDVNIATIRGFTMTVTNNLQVGPYAGDPPILQSLKPGAQDVTLEITDELHDHDYREDIRDFNERTFVAKFVHPNGSSIQFKLPLIEGDEAPDAHEEIIMENPRFTARKPSTEDMLQITVAGAS